MYLIVNQTKWCEVIFLDLFTIVVVFFLLRGNVFYVDYQSINFFFYINLFKYINYYLHLNRRQAGNKLRR